MTNRKIILIFSVIACLAWGPLAMLDKAQAAQVSIKTTQIDPHFIMMMEGAKVKGYVPLVATTESGVTIAHGFDLGQLSLREFNKLTLKDSLKDRLRPYVGLKKYAALNFLQKHPLTISNAEMQEINIAAANQVLLPLIKYYNRASGKSFLELPAAAQTAIFSYAYQNGYGFMYRSESKKLWYYFVTQNWSKASEQLRSFSAYKSRRDSEAALLSKLA